jgi:hypothetical protein
LVFRLRREDAGARANALRRGAWDRDNRQRWCRLLAIRNGLHSRPRGDCRIGELRREVLALAGARHGGPMPADIGVALDEHRHAAEVADRDSAPLASTEPLSLIDTRLSATWFGGGGSAAAPDFEATLREFIEIWAMKHRARVAQREAGVDGLAHDGAAEPEDAPRLQRNPD